MWALPNKKQVLDNAEKEEISEGSLEQKYK